MKKPDQETESETVDRQHKEKIANHANRSEKTAWSRKEKQMERLITQLEPIDDQMLTLLAQKQIILDEITLLRQEMVDTCIHPFHLLVAKDGYVECKFCNRKLNNVQHD